MREWSSSIQTAIIVLSITLIGLRYSLYIGGWIAAFLFAIGGYIFFILVTFLIIWTICFVWTKELTRKNILSIVIGVVAILISIFEPIELVAEGLKSRIVLFGECEHSMTSVFIALREDGTFEYNAGAFLKKEEYIGEYRITGDSLILNYEGNQIKDLPTKMVFEKNGAKTNGLICSGDTTEHRHHFILTINETEQ